MRIRYVIPNPVSGSLHFSFRIPDPRVPVPVHKKRDKNKPTFFMLLVVSEAILKSQEDNRTTVLFFKR
jgi:hypothetical protein